MTTSSGVCTYRYTHDGKFRETWFASCDGCGAEYDYRVAARHCVYCPRCGRRVRCVLDRNGREVPRDDE